MRLLNYYLGVLCLVFSAPSFSETDPDLPVPGCSTPDQEVVALVRIQPGYPLSAALLCLEGNVQLLFDIGPDGRVGNINVNKSEPAGIFDQAAIRAVQRWLFLPRCVAGEPTSRSATQIFQFELPADALGQCLDLDDADAVELLSELASHYSLIAEQRLGWQFEPINWQAPEPRFEGDLGQIEQFHMQLISRNIERHNRILSQMMVPGLRDVLSARNLSSDQGMEAARSDLERLDSVMREAIDESTSVMRQDYVRAQSLRESLTTTEQRWQALVGKFIADPTQQQSATEQLRRHHEDWYDSAKALLDFLDNHRGDWRPDNDNPHWPDFTSRELAEEFNRLSRRLGDASDQFQAESMQWSLFWANPVL